MIVQIRYSIGGDRKVLKALLQAIGVRADIIDYPARSRMYLKLNEGQAEQIVLEAFVKRHNLDVGRDSEIQASPDELVSEHFFSNVGCCWIEDDEGTLDPVPVTGEDACPKCGKGIRAYADPLHGAMHSLRRYHLVRKPQAWVLGSSRLVDLVREHKWSGVEVRPIIERTTGRESKEFSELWITSVLPPMHESAGLERFNPSKLFCEHCKRVGYQLLSRQPIYSRDVFQYAVDWNLSTEWMAPHFVACPKLICSRRVVHELLKLEPTEKWIPVKVMD